MAANRGLGASLRHSLKFRLTVIIGGSALVTTVLLSNIIGAYARKHIESDKGSLLCEVAVQMTTRLNQDMNSRAQEIRFLGELRQIHNPATPQAQIQALFEQVKHSYPHYAWIGMTDAAGTIRVGTGGLLVGKDVSKREWFVEGRTSLHFGNAHDAFLLAKMLPKPRWDDLPLRLVDVSVPVFDEEGALLGVICGHLSLDWAFEVRERMLANLTDRNVEMLVLNREGQILLGTPALPSLSTHLADLQSFKLAQSGQKTFVKERWFDGVTYLAVALTEPGFRDYPGMGWVVVAREDKRLAFEPARRLQNTVISLGAAFAGLFAWLLWWTLNRQLKPLEAVSRAADRLRSNDLTAEIPVIQGHDEIAVFARSLTDLVGNLQDNNKELYLAGRLFEESNQGIIITDAQGIIIRVNNAFCGITKYRSEEVIGQRPSILKSDRQDAQFYADMWHAITTTGIWRGEIWNRNKEGKIYPEWLNINALCDDAGTATHYIGLFDDISEKKEHEQMLVHLANYDLLTNLPNRNLLQQKILDAIYEADASGSHLAILFTDLDQFKNINDTLGHPSGDVVLSEVARRFQESVAEGQIVARWGGDEFVIVLPGSDESHAVKAVNALFAALSAPFAIEQRLYHLSASIGVALFPQDSRTVDGLLRCSDMAMYQAKQEGKNRYSFFDASMNTRVKQFLEIDNALRGALDRSELYLEYQPQFDVTGTDLVGMEALLRWRNPVLGDVSPEVFIPIAEMTGQINTIGLWVADQAMQALGKWNRHGNPTVSISINISTKQLLEPGLDKRLLEMAGACGVAPSQCKLEVTESTIMSVDGMMSDVLKQIRIAGFPLSIDDFGTGYSSLNAISRIKPDEIKIDRSFIRDITTNQDSRNIVIFTINLARAMGIGIVAEGVETPEQAALLRDLGNVRFQGFLLARPMLLDDILADYSGRSQDIAMSRGA